MSKKKEEKDILLKDKIAHELMELLTFTRGSEIVIPNCYVGRWEMDILRLQKNKILVEYEIKTTRNDFKNDAKKSYDEVTYLRNENNKFIKENGKFKKEIEHKNKLDLIKNRKYVANRFYYVVPEGLISPSELPERVGLIYYKTNGKRSQFDIVVTSPMINKEKHFSSINEIHDLAIKCSFREVTWRKKYYKINTKYKKIVKK